jgi:hypothetical protein
MQKRLIILRSLLIEATPFHCICFFVSDFPVRLACHGSNSELVEARKSNRHGRNLVRGDDRKVYLTECNVFENDVWNWASC